MGNFRVVLNKAVLADFYLGVSDAFREGRVQSMAREYLFRARAAQTRFNTRALRRVPMLLNEIALGYGLKPMRVVVAMGCALGAGTEVFARHLPYRDSLLLATGAMFTFGANTDRLRNLPTTDVLVYVF